MLNRNFLRRRMQNSAAAKNEFYSDFSQKKSSWIETGGTFQYNANGLYQPYNSEQGTIPISDWRYKTLDIPVDLNYSTEVNLEYLYSHDVVRQGYGGIEIQLYSGNTIIYQGWKRSHWGGTAGGGLFEYKSAKFFNNSINLVATEKINLTILNNTCRLFWNNSQIGSITIANASVVKITKIRIMFYSIILSHVTASFTLNNLKIWGK